jgi:hypothetical protein
MYIRPYIVPHFWITVSVSVSAGTDHGYKCTGRRAVGLVQLLEGTTKAVYCLCAHYAVLKVVPIDHSLWKEWIFPDVCLNIALYKDFFPPIFHLKNAVTFLILHQNKQMRYHLNEERYIFPLIIILWLCNNYIINYYAISCKSWCVHLTKISCFMFIQMVKLFTISS